MKPFKLRFLLSGLMWALILAAMIAGERAAADGRSCVELFSEGQKEYQQANYDTALEMFLTARECLLQESGGEETESTANCLNETGAVYYSLGDYEKALNSYNTSLGIFLNIFGEEHQLTAKNYNNIGMIYHALGDYERALGNYDKALEIRLKVLGEEHATTATSYNNIGSTHAALGDYSTAMADYKKALEIYRKTLGEEHRLIATSYNNIGSVHESLGDYEQALENYNKALKIDLKVLGELNAETATDYNNIGQACYTLGDFEGARRNYNKALNILLQVVGEAHLLTATCYNNIGAVYDSFGDYEQALENYNKALEIRLQIVGAAHPSTAGSYNNIGQAYDSLGDYNRALENYNKSLGVYINKFGDMHPETAAQYNNIGAMFYSAGDYNQALENYLKASLIHQKLFGEEHQLTATSHINIGAVYDSLGDSGQALENYNKALDVYKKTLGEEHPLTAASYISAGAVYDSLGNYKRAIENYRNAIVSLCGSSGESDAGDCRPVAETVLVFWSLAKALMSSEEYGESAAAYMSAAEALDRLRGAMKSEESKKIHGAKYYDMFPEGIGAYVALADKTGGDDALGHAFEFAEKSIGRVFMEMIGRSRAEVDGGLPAEIIQKKLSLEQEWKRALDAAQKEESKSKDERDLSARKAAYEQFQAAEAELEEFESQLLMDYPDYAELMNPRTRSLSEIREEVLSDDEAALEYILGEKGSYLIFITKEKIKVKHLPPANEIKNLVMKLRYQLAPVDCSYPDSQLENCKKQNADADEDEKKSCKEFMDEWKACERMSREPAKDALIAHLAPGAGQTGKQLYDMLISPVEEDIPEAGKLIIVPTGDLYFLPFEALAVATDAKTVYLVENHEIRYAPSLNVLYLTKMRMEKESSEPAEKEKVLGFGDPVYSAQDERAENCELNEETEGMMVSYSRALSEGGKQKNGDWQRIPGTGQEIQAIQELFENNDENLSIKLGLDATESNFKELAPRGYKFIHIASHGTLGEGGAYQPALVLSLVGNEETGENGFLTMTEVINTKTPADMIVLSACKTGQGKMEKGEGVAGMSRAFLYSGAASLVVSLWSVDDIATKNLMVDFYNKIISGTNRESALRESKLDMIEQGLAPFYWAPFVYIGSN